MSSEVVDLPSLATLGRDLLTVHLWRRAASLATPFLLTTAFFLFAANGLWIASLVCTMLLTFFTYGSISHDLVHRTLRLPRSLNEVLLCAIELMAFRSDTHTASRTSITMRVSRQPTISKELPRG